MKTDVLIIGGGPGGSAMAMFLLREGIKPVILEQEEFPRFHIGESLTGEAGQVLRRLGFADAMAKREYPVKHGVKVYGTTGEHSWFVPVSARDKDWNLSFGHTWQVRRRNSDALFSPVAAAVRVSDTSGEDAKDSTVSFYAKEFHWSWFIPLDKVVVSIGMVTPNADFLAKKQPPEEFFRNEYYGINPRLRERVP